MMITFGGNQMKIVKLIALTTFLALTSVQSLERVYGLLQHCKNKQ